MIPCRMRMFAGTFLLFLWMPAAFGLTTQTIDVNKARSFAESQHEIVMILIGKKDFSKAAEEANKIFQMNWPAELEPLLLKEIKNFSEQFNLQKQQVIAIQMLDANLAQFKAAKSKAEIWKEKGYLYEKLGQHDKALECFREAQRLEKTGEPEEIAESALSVKK